MDALIQMLVARAINGDQAALAELLEEVGCPLIAEFEHRIAPKYRALVDADDVMQVTYLEAFLRIGSFVWTGSGSFASWLRRIAENNLKDAIRGLERDKRPSPGLRKSGSDDSGVALFERMASSTSTASRKASREESLRVLELAIRQLPSDYQQVIRLYDLEELAGPEVAERMQRSHGAVRMMLHRARARLSELLGSESLFF